MAPVRIWQYLFESIRAACRAFFSAHFCVLLYAFLYASAFVEQEFSENCFQMDLSRELVLCIDTHEMGVQRNVFSD